MGAREPTLDSQPRHEFTRLCMGVKTRVVIAEPIDAQAAAALANKAFERIEQLEQSMSDYRRESELSLLCNQAGGPAREVSQDLFAVLALAKQINEVSEGAFDVTVGPATLLWRDIRAGRAAYEPQTIETARSRIGSQYMVLDDQASTVQLTKAGMRLDLGGIAKGYAAQAAVDVLSSNGCKSVLVALAGDVVVGDAPPGQDGWRIMISSGDVIVPIRGTTPPDSSPQSSSILGTILLENSAISTSGDTAQFIEIDGKRYSHLIDPRTGIGIAPGRSVSVIAPRGELADALSSAMCIAGPEKLHQIVARMKHPLAVITASAEATQASGLTVQADLFGLDPRWLQQNVPITTRKPK